MVITRVCLALLAAGLLSQASPQQSSPETIYYNGHIVTMWSEHPEVEAVAISARRYVAVGSNADIRKRATAATREVDLSGRTFLPGLQYSLTQPIAASLSE